MVMTTRRIQNVSLNNDGEWTSHQPMHTYHSKKSSSVVCPAPKNPSNYWEYNMLSSRMERQYDCATWRMYHRITTARRKRATVAPYAMATSVRNFDRVGQITDAVDNNSSLTLPVTKCDGEYCHQPNIEDQYEESSSGIFQLDMS
mmetsp:Transcript_65437/g.77462  ORF Transcript_65437/g.77462 Transcript_65437/m.77462 type:complete len:145 (-) Transcript_65437:266-700(-)